MTTNYSYIPCRAVIGHNWHIDIAGLPKAPDTITARFGWRFECGVCGTTKDVFYDQDGIVERTRYKWPEGYKIDAEKSALRVELFTAMEMNKVVAAARTRNTPKEAKK